MTLWQPRAPASQRGRPTFLRFALNLCAVQSRKRSPQQKSPHWTRFRRFSSPPLALKPKSRQRPLRPSVLVFDTRVPREQALVLDLERVPELGIRRSLKPALLPPAAQDYLMPPPRICYFFERPDRTGL